MISAITIVGRSAHQLISMSNGRFRAARVACSVLCFTLADKDRRRVSLQRVTHVVHIASAVLSDGRALARSRLLRQYRDQAPCFTQDTDIHYCGCGARLRSRLLLAAADGTAAGLQWPG